jgi:hypothetical protein
MEIAKIMSPHQHITVKAHHWDSMRSASAIACFIISLLSIAVRDIVVLIFIIIWFIWASTAQQQRTIFWHRGRSVHHQNWVFDREHCQNQVLIGSDWVWLCPIPIDRVQSSLIGSIAKIGARFWQAPDSIKLTEIAARKSAKLPFPKFLLSVPDLPEGTLPPKVICQVIVK